MSKQILFPEQVTLRVSRKIYYAIFVTAKEREISVSQLCREIITEKLRSQFSEKKLPESVPRDYVFPSPVLTNKDGIEREVH